MSRALQFEPAAAVAHLQASDPTLAALIARVGPFTLEPRPAQSLFEELLRSIVYQQLNGRAASTILDRTHRVLAAHGGTTPEALARTADGELRAAGLSKNKLRAVRDLAAKCLDGTVPTLEEARRWSDDELVDHLTSVHGIGPWTVHMLLIFVLGRGDVMPTGDFAIRSAFRQLYRKRRAPTPATILRHARRWRPYRSVASWYLWRSLDTTT
jgi:DNA-3-methyladenine glycosylase II